MADLFKFKILNDYTQATPCVYRMNFGKKSFIWKGKSIVASLKQMNVELRRRVNQEKPLADGDLFARLIPHIKAYRLTKVDVTILFESRKGKEIIFYEADMLKEAEQDPDNLNCSYVPYVPTWIDADHIMPQIDPNFVSEQLPVVTEKVSKIKEKSVPVVKQEPLLPEQLEMPDISGLDLDALLKDFRK